MSILVNRRTRVITQGITGRSGRFHTSMCRHYANGKHCFVAGVNPKRGGESFEDIPVFGTVKQAKEQTGATVSVIYVPPEFAAAAIDEAVDAELDLVVCVTQGIPAADMLRTRSRMQGRKTLLLGPNCPGLITPGEISIGMLPGPVHQPGRIGIVSRSGTLNCEAARQLASFGLGQSTVVGVGSDAIGGMGHLDVLKRFNDDPGTDAVILVGRIGGEAEVACARWIREHMRKPVIAYTADGLAGDDGSIESDAFRKSALKEHGIPVTRHPDEMAQLLASLVSPACLPFD